MGVFASIRACFGIHSGRLPFFYSLLKLVIRPTMKRQYPAGGWDIEWVEVSQDQIALNIHRCFYLDTLTEYGAPELTALFCRYSGAAEVC